MFDDILTKRAMFHPLKRRICFFTVICGRLHCQQVSVLLYNIIIFIIHIYVSYTYFTVYIKVCVCVLMRSW